MDIASMIGFVLGLLLIVMSIGMAQGTSLAAFIDYPSMVMVLGGCLASTLICFPLRDFLNLARVIKKVFVHKAANLTALVEQMVWLAETARRDGLLALEGRLAEISNPFVVLGIQMVVDGTRPEVIEDILRSEIDATASRHRNGKSVMEQLGRFAPAFGMIGTLVGLIIMLGNMNDPDSIAPGMAVALITTLYGSILANGLFLPCAEKLGFINQQELMAMEIVVRGIMGIQSGDHPRVIEQRLSSFVPPKQRSGFRKAA